MTRKYAVVQMQVLNYESVFYSYILLSLIYYFDKYFKYYLRTTLSINNIKVSADFRYSNYYFNKCTDDDNNMVPYET